MPGDLFIDVRSDANLLEALTIAFSGQPNARYWRAASREIDKSKIYCPQLIFAWHEGDDCIPFPTPVTATEAVGIALSWLKAQTEFWALNTGYDGDGDNHRGFRVHNKSLCLPYSICAVEPDWQYYSK